MEPNTSTQVMPAMTDANYTQELADFSKYDNIMVPCIWGAIFIAGIAGNSLVVFVMLKYGDVNTTNCYIINLAATDLVFIVVVIPFTMLHYVLPSWIFGRWMCKFHTYMVVVCLHGTCLTLTAMSIDRYFAIVHPIKSMIHRTPRVAVAVSAATWMVSIMVCAPFGVYMDVVEHPNAPGETLCREMWPSEIASKASLLYIVTVTYIIPLMVIMVCYSLMLRRVWKNKASVKPQPGTSHSMRMQGQKRRKAAKMVAVVIWLFATCWLPIHIFQLWTKFDRHFPRTEVTYVYKILAHAVSYANSCVNPVVYSFLGDGFRKAVRKAFPKIFRVTGSQLVQVNSSSHETRRQAGGATRLTTLPPSSQKAGHCPHETHIELTVRRDIEPNEARMLSRQMSLPGTSTGHRLSAVEEMTV